MKNEKRSAAVYGSLHDWRPSAPDYSTPPSSPILPSTVPQPLHHNSCVRHSGCDNHANLWDDIICLKKGVADIHPSTITDTCILYVKSCIYTLQKPGVEKLLQCPILNYVIISEMLLKVKIQNCHLYTALSASNEWVFI